MENKKQELLGTENIIDTNEFGLSAMVAFGYRSDEAEIFPKTLQPIEKVVEWIL